MLGPKLFLTAFLVQVIAKEIQLNSSTKKNSPYINLSNLQCQCMNESFCKYEQCRLKAVRRNEAQLFVNISIFQGPITNCMVNIDLYRKYTVYNPFPFNVTVDACQFLENTHKYPIFHNIYQMFAKNTNLNHSCPYYEKNLVVHNVSIPYTPYFSFVPAGRYKANIKWILNDVIRAIIIIWIEIHNSENNLFREGF